MKKLLLISLALSFTVIAGAQQRELPKNVYKAERRSIISDKMNPDTQASTQNNQDPYGGLSNSSRDILKVPMSSSSNAYGIFNMDQNILTTDPELDMVVFGNRAGGAMGGSGNDLVYSYSTDRGLTFTNFTITSPNTNNWFRYPSTVFYNPEGNTDPANMYAIFTGPYTVSAGWKGQYYGSVKFDGTTDKNVIFEENAAGIYLNHLHTGLTVTPGGNIHVMSNRLNGTEASYTSVGFEVQNGVFNNETKMIDWDLPRISVNPELDDDNNLWATDMVYSPDGSVGYLVCTGLDPDPNYNPYSYNGTVEWPVIYKTVDNGATWNKIEPFDFSSMEIWQEYLYPTRMNLDLIIPRFFNRWVSGPNQNGYIVDMNGNLHISAPIVSTMSLDIDSTNFFYSEEPTLLFDVFMNGDGTWDATFIDTIRTEPVQTVGDEIGYDQRIFMSRNSSGSKVFTTWADTDPAYLSGVTTNTQPDIFTWGMDVTTKQITPAKNETLFGDYWTNNYWLHVGNVVLEAEDEYQIPMSTSICTEPPASVLKPWTHYYVSGVSIMVDVDDIEVISNSSISDNYPNPFKSTTEFSLTLDKPASVAVEVYSVVGQKVISIPVRDYSAGTHKVTINANDLKPGVYVYSVIANGERASRKMTVR